jgi:hypothetical protein
MKKFFIYLLLVSISASGQSWTHAKLDPNYNCWNEMHASALDANSNLYMAGVFEPCYHGGGPYGMYLNKYDPNGDLIWSDTVCSRTLGVVALFLTNNNTLRLIGQFYNDTTNFFGFIFNSNDTLLGYTAEFDLAGNCLSATLLPYLPIKAELSPDGSISMVGQCFQPITNLNFYPSSTYFIGRFNDFSTAYWLQSVSSFAWNYNTDLKTAANGDIYLSELNGHVTKYTATSNTTITSSASPVFHCIGNSFYLTSTYNGNIFEKYSSTGALLWHKVFSPFTFITSISNYNNHLLLAGYFIDSFRYGNLSVNIDTGSSYRNLLLLEVDSNGNEIRLLHAPHSDDFCGYSQIETKGLQTNGTDIFLAGEIQAGIIFGTDTLESGCMDPNSVFHAKANLYTSGIPNIPVAKEKKNFYPNPFHDETRIDLNNLQDKKGVYITILSPEGIPLKTNLCTDDYFILDRGELHTGFFLYSVTNRNGLLLSSGKIILD